MEMNTFRVILVSILPTFSFLVSKHKKLAALIGVLYLFATVFLFSVGLSTTYLPSQALSVTGPNIFPATAYGSQKHIVANGNLLILVYLNQNNQITARFSNNNGESWQELNLPIASETVADLAVAWDKKQTLHLVYENDGNILYRQISDILADNQIKSDGWKVSSPVKLDVSGFAHRPSLILESSTDLPAVVWALQGEGGAGRTNKILFMRAKGEPIVLDNWCNSNNSSCGLSSYTNSGGSTDDFMIVGVYPSLHPVLVQMPQTGDFYIFWSESMKGRNNLNRVIAKKEADKWIWNPREVQDSLTDESAKTFDLSAAADQTANRIVIVYINANGNTKVVAYKNGGDKEDLSLGQKLGTQFSLASKAGKIYLAYRKENGKLAVSQHEISWSTELVESPLEGGYPSLGLSDTTEELLMAYTTLEKKVELLKQNLTAPTVPATTPGESATPAASPEPTATPEITTVPTSSPSSTPQ